MSFNYRIKVSTDNEINGEKEKSDFETLCSFKGNEYDYTLEYEEQTEDGVAVTTLHYKKDKGLSIKRKSVMSTFFLLQKGKRHLSHIATPYGTMDIGITCNEITSQVNDTCGTLCFSYITDIDNSPLGFMNFKIHFNKYS